jgi:hypothetical protein
MATRASITVGDIGWTTVGRLVTGALVLYVVAIALVYDGSCFPSCDNVRFWVMFLPLGFFGVVLCLLAGNSVAAGTVQRRNVFNASSWHLLRRIDNLPRVIRRPVAGYGLFGCGRRSFRSEPVQ